MADHDDPKQGPNPAFLSTKMLGSRRVDALDYEDEAPTGVDHKPSNRPLPRSAPPARVDPGDVYMLTDPPARQDLPSFADTVVGHGSLETPLTHLPPVAPAPGAPPLRVSPLAHSPTPPPPRGAWPTAPLPPPADHRAPTANSSPSSPPRQAKPRRQGIWKPVYPAPRYMSRPPVAQPIKPDPSVHDRERVPVEDRLLNAILVLVVGACVALGASWAFLNVTHTRAPALSDFIASPTGSTPPP